MKQGLIAFWTFDDPTGSATAEDTSGNAHPVPLEIVTNSNPNPDKHIDPPVFSSGSLVVETPAKLFSALNTHLDLDCKIAGGVTLEIWAKPLVPDANTNTLFVAGLSFNVQQRNIALLQAGTHWVGRVRTAQASDGSPDLTSTSSVSTTSFSHIAIVADATQRTMYVDDSSQATGIAGTLNGWNESFAMALVDEYPHGNMWTGTLALVALYNRALTREEVHQNFAAGPMH